MHSKTSVCYFADCLQAKNLGFAFLNYLILHELVINLRENSGSDLMNLKHFQVLSILIIQDAWAMAQSSEERRGE